MTAKPIPPTSYAEAARRHLTDAEALFTSGRKANAGQLYGFMAECGMKALLVACGVQTDNDGGIAKKGSAQPLRQHVPVLVTRINDHFSLIPAGPTATKYMAMISGTNGNLSDWSVDHRYWRELALPLTSVEGWRKAAQDVGTMLDQAKEDGVL